MKPNNRRRSFNSAKIHPLNFLGALVTLSCVTGISYLIASSIVRVEVPTDHIGIKREKGWIPYLSKETLSTVRAGVHEVRSNTTFFAVPDGTHQVPFKVGVTPGGIKSWIPGFGEDPSLVEGTVSIEYTEARALSLISSGNDVHIETALLVDLKESIATNLDKKDNFEAFGDKTTEELHKRLSAGFEGTVGRVSIKSVSSFKGDLEDSIGTSVKTLSPLSHVPLKELARYFWVSAILSLLMFGSLCFYQPLFVLLSGVVIWFPVFLLNLLFGAGIDSPLDFDIPDLDLDLDIDFDL